MGRVAVWGAGGSRPTNRRDSPAPVMTVTRGPSKTKVRSLGPNTAVRKIDSLLFTWGRAGAMIIMIYHDFQLSVVNNRTEQVMLANTFGGDRCQSSPHAKEHETLFDAVPQLQLGNSNVGALIIRTGFWGVPYYNYSGFRGVPYYNYSIMAKTLF